MVALPLSDWMLGSAIAPVSFVPPKGSQKYTKAYIQLSATGLFKELTKIPTKNSTAFGEVSIPRLLFQARGWEEAGVQPVSPYLNFRT